MAFIRRKKRGSTFYFELVESVREGAKVSQKVLKYFPTLDDANLYCESKGIRKIENENVISPSLEARVKSELRRLNASRPLPETALRKLKDKFEVDMTYNSNAIEGNRLTLRETYLVIRKGMTIGGRSVEEHLEAKNHLEALERLYELADSKKEIMEEDILELHKLVMSKIDESIAGKYRQGQVYIEGAVHVPPNAAHVPGLMKEVIGMLNGHEKEAECLKAASRIHHKITWIHPFADGNGRVARLLLNLKLMRGKFPPIVLESKKRKAYYAALEKADAGDFYPITTLIASAAENSLDIWLSVL